MNARTLTRNDVTWAAYALSLMFTLLLGLIGPLLPHLRAELGISYGVAALHTSAFAVGDGNGRRGRRTRHPADRSPGHRLDRCRRTSRRG